jgi:L-amino acid N-acyltransferase YncA
MIIRSATMHDASDMVAVLNPIITAGGTTAHQRPFDAERMQSHYIAPKRKISCMVAEDAGRVIGFQSLNWPQEDDDSFLDGWAIIASFVAPDAAGKGVGPQLFAATKIAARASGIQVIDATIRADNVPGLRYYSGLGFVDYDLLENVPLGDGSVVDRVRKRYDL